MVEILSRGESIKCLFGEDIGVVSILRREDNVVFLSSDSEFGGQSGFSDMFIIKRNSFLYPINTGIVLCQPRHPQDYLGSS